GALPVTSGTVIFLDGATPISGALTLNSSGQASLTISTLTAGSHTITASYSGTASASGSTGFAASSGAGSLSVNKADQTITWATPAPIVYGTALSSTQLNATVAGVSGGSAPGALTYSPASGTVLNAGNQALSVTAAATSNYNQTTRSVTLEVDPAATSTSF